MLGRFVHFLDLRFVFAYIRNTPLCHVVHLLSSLLGRPRPRRAAPCRPPPCGAAAGLYLVLFPPYHSVFGCIPQVSLFLLATVLLIVVPRNGITAWYSYLGSNFLLSTINISKY